MLLWFCYSQPCSDGQPWTLLSDFLMGDACIITPCSTRALELLFCWVFPVHSTLWTTPPIRTFSMDSVSTIVERSYCYVFMYVVLNLAPFGCRCVHIPSKVASESSLTVHLGLTSLPNSQLRWWVLPEPQGCQLCRLGGGEGSKRNETLNETPAPLTPGTELQKSLSGAPR